jgi:hypothetical protein
MKYNLRKLKRKQVLRDPYIIMKLKIMLMLRKAETPRLNIRILLIQLYRQARFLSIKIMNWHKKRFQVKRNMISITTTFFKMWILLISAKLIIIIIIEIHKKLWKLFKNKNRIYCLYIMLLTREKNNLKKEVRIYRNRLMKMEVNQALANLFVGLYAVLQNVSQNFNISSNFNLTWGLKF